MAEKPKHGLATFANREMFMVDLLTHVSDVLQKSVGKERAEELMAAAAFRMARDVTRDIGDLPIEDQTARETAENLVSLKAQIGGRFEVARQDAESVEFHGCRCPFGENVKGRDSLCQMTSGVFGRVVADTMGYARVTVVESIARGHDGCKVVVDLRRGQDDAAPADAPADPPAIEYFRLPSDET